MIDGVPAAESSATPRGSGPGNGIAVWRHWLPLGFVMVALFALALIPFLAARRSYAVEQEIRETISPARNLATDLQLALAIGGAALRDYLVTGDTVYLRRYREAVAEERRAYERLAPLARRLGADAWKSYTELVTSLSQWYAAVEELLRRPGDPARSAEIPRHDLYEEAVIAVAQLDLVIGRIGDVRRAEARASEERELALTMLLFAVALVAAVGVGWIGWRLNYYAETAERRRLEVERAMESRARLMRGFSHDVKNPLGAADGQLQLLEMGVMGRLSAEQRARVDRARTSIGAALDLIEDLVELARAEAGQIEIHTEPTDAREVARRVAEEYRAAAEAAGLVLDVAVAEDLPEFETDPRRVRQILSNLLSNAVKYTPEGGRITIRAMLADGGRAPGPGRWIAIAVSDTGPGIPPEKQELVFQEFTRLEPGGIRGAGLGLAISRRIARDLGGDITVESEVGQGATFTLWLPLRPAGGRTRRAT